MGSMIHINFLTVAFVRVFDCKIVQGDFERSLIEFGHFDIVTDLRRRVGEGVCELRSSEVVRSRVVSRLVDKLMRKGLIPNIYRDLKDSCYFMDVKYVVEDD